MKEVSVSHVLNSIEQKDCNSRNEATDVPQQSDTTANLTSEPSGSTNLSLHVPLELRGYGSRYVNTHGAFDTMATISFVRADVVRSLRCKTAPSKVKVILGDGKTELESPITAHLSATTNGRRWEWWFQVLEDLQHPVIFGQDFMASCGINLSWSTPQDPSSKSPKNQSPMTRNHSKIRGEHYHPTCNSRPTTICTISVEDDDNMQLWGGDKKLFEELVANLPEKAKAILRDFQSIVKEDVDGTTNCKTGVPFEIKLLSGAKAYKRTPYTISPKERGFVEEQITKLAKNGMIRPSRSSWGSPVVLVRKKDGTLRMCIDYRQLNKATIDENYPLEVFEEIFDRLQGKLVFTTLDFKSGYWQILMAEDSISLTAFTSHMGLWEWLRLPFGLKNAVVGFQRLMKRILAGLEHCCAVHVDDILIFSANEEEHDKHVRLVLTRIAEAGMILNISKCHWFQSKLIFLGHIFSKDGMATDPDKVRKIVEMPTPVNVKGVRSFLGICNYYRRFIKDFSMIAHPLNNLTKTGTEFVWTDKCQKALDTLKEKLTSSPCLAYPDFKKPFSLHCDMSHENNAISAILLQADSTGVKHPISFSSRTLSDTESRYSVTEKECLAILLGIDKYRHYLCDEPFEAVTDHKALQWLHEFKGKNDRLLRWSLLLQGFKMHIVARPGVNHGDADGLSRIPQCCSLEWVEKSKLEKLKAERLCSITCERKHSWCIPPNIFSTQTATQPNGSQAVRLAAMSEEGEGSRGDIGLKTTIHDSTIDQYGEKESKRNYQQLSKRKTDPTVDTILIDLLQGKKELKHTQLPNKSYRRWISRALAKFSWDKTRTCMVYHGRRVVPLIERKDLILNEHAKGHFGIQATIANILKTSWWPGVYGTVRTVLNDCPHCARFNVINKKRDTSNIPLRVVPGVKKWSIDLVGPLPTTLNDNKYFLTMVQDPESYADAVPITGKAKEKVARALWSLMTKYGPPHEIMSDQGSEFVNSTLQAMNDLVGVDRKVTSAYRPQVNGKCERMNGVIVSALSKVLGQTGSLRADWDEWLPYVMYSINSRPTRASTHKYTPYFMMYGYDVPLFTDYTGKTNTELPKSATKEAEDLAQEIEQRVGHLWHLTEIIQPELIETVTEKAKKRMKPMMFRDIPVGTWVSILIPDRNRTKLDPHYKGLYRIVAKTAMGLYKVEAMQGYDLQTPVHPSRIKVLTMDTAKNIAFSGVEEEGRETNEPTPEGEYEMEKILNHRTNHGKLEFLVKYLDYIKPEWTPAANLTTSDMANLYWDTHITPQISQFDDSDDQEKDALIEQTNSDEMKPVQKVAAMHVMKPANGQLTNTICNWLLNLHGKLDLDLFASSHRAFNCSNAVTDFHKQGKEMVRLSKTILINPPWFYFMWIGDWLLEYAQGKLIVVIVPHFRGYNKIIAQWKVDWLRKTLFPRQFDAWFTDGIGRLRSLPHWDCEAWFGRVRTLSHS